MLSPVRSQEDADPLVTMAWIAGVFRVDRKTVSRWCKAGRLAAIRTPGGHWRVRRSAVEALLHKGETP